MKAIPDTENITSFAKVRVAGSNLVFRSTLQVRGWFSTSSHRQTKSVICDARHAPVPERSLRLG